MTEKTPNYTEAQTAQIVADYTAKLNDSTPEEAAEWLKTYAASIDRKPSSVRGKLSREGVYVKPGRQSKRNATKAELVTKIAGIVGLTDDVAGSLEKATAKPLAAILETLQTMREELEDRNAEGDSFPMEAD